MAGSGLCVKLLVIFCLCAISTYYTREAMIAWEESPTVTSASWIPLRDMKFPALTVCPVQDSRWIGILNLMKKKDPEAKEAIKAYSQLTESTREKFVALIQEIVKRRTPLKRFGKVKWAKDASELIYKNPDIKDLANFFLDIPRNETEKRLNQVAEWRVAALDHWVGGKTPDQIFAAISETENAASNVSKFVVVSVKWSVLNELLDFYYFVKLVTSHEKYMTPQDFPAFLVDLVTNVGKYGTRLGGSEWKVLAAYITSVSEIQGIPGPILFDLANMIQGGKLDYFDPIANLKWKTWPGYPYEISPELWMLYDSNLGLVGLQCLADHNQAGCVKLLERVQHLEWNIDMEEFLEKTMQPAHFSIPHSEEPQAYNYPMIPFCWFGGPLYWIGSKNMSGNMQQYNAVYLENDPDKLLKWCDVFEPSFPEDPNCYTVNGSPDSEFKIGQIEQVGDDNGFTFVLENYFGQNGLKQGLVSHKLYIHETGAVPDRLNLFGQGISIFRGKKHNINIGAGIFQSTGAFRDLPYADRKCLLDTESQLQSTDNENGTESKIFGKYTTINCIVEKLVLESRCACMRTGFVVNPGVVMYVSGRAGLPQTEVTWAKILQENGYDTAAVGKWHLGWDESSYGDQQHGPLGHGFNHFFGMPFTLVDGFEETRPFFTYSQFSAEEKSSNPLHNHGIALVLSFLTVMAVYSKDLGYFVFGVIILLFLTTWFLIEHFSIHKEAWWRRSLYMEKYLNSVLMANKTVVEQPIQLKSLVDKLTEFSVDFIKGSKNRSGPFALYHAFPNVHTPLEPHPRFRGRSQHGRYGASIMEMDEAVGKILEAIAESGLEEDTLVYFASDHGTHIDLGNLGGSNGQFKGGKGMGPIEGGIRIPGAIKWPGKIKPGTNLDNPTSLLDFLPTVKDILESSGKRSMLGTKKLDGTSFLSDLKSNGGNTKGRIFSHYCGSSLQAIRIVRGNTGDVFKVYRKVPIVNKDTGHCGSGNLCPCFGDDSKVRTFKSFRIFDLKKDPYENEALDEASERYSEVAAEAAKAFADADKEAEGFPPSQFSSFANLMPRPWMQPCANFPSCKT